MIMGVVQLRYGNKNAQPKVEDVYMKCVQLETSLVRPSLFDSFLTAYALKDKFHQNIKTFPLWI